MGDGDQWGTSQNEMNSGNRVELVSPNQIARVSFFGRGGIEANLSFHRISTEVNLWAFGSKITS